MDIIICIGTHYEYTYLCDFNIITRNKIMILTNGAAIASLRCILYWMYTRTIYKEIKKKNVKKKKKTK